jgi:hypothetical protein
VGSFPAALLHGSIYVPQQLSLMSFPLVQLPEGEFMFNAKAYSVSSAKSPFAPTSISRRDPGENDVQIEILFCGICHSDLHSVRN